MDAIKFSKLNNLYKSLKQLDLDILGKFNCTEIADEDYFSYGIQNDVVSNALNILVNYLSGNIESVGVDNSCRMILEALTIFKMDTHGDISPIQKSIYRYGYAYVDLDNFKLVTPKEQFQEEQFKRIKADRNKCSNYIKKHFGCEYEDIVKRKNGSDDPCFYLKKKINSPIVFTKLIDKYFPENKDMRRLYDFFSIMIHPRCEMDPTVEKDTMNLHQHFVDDIINLVSEFLSNNHLLPSLKYVNDFNSDFFYNPLLTINVNNIKETELAFNLMIKSICGVFENYDWFTWFFLEKTKYLVLDMLISLSLGYTEHVIASFKPFAEMFSIFYVINTHENITEFELLKRSYFISSRIQFNEHFKTYNIAASNHYYKEELQSLYDNYYATQYNIDSFSKFYDKYLHNSLYFLDDSKKSFNKFVREAFEGIAIDEMQAKDLMTTYKISKDMTHASGYSFNATVDLVRITSHKVIHSSLFMLYQFLLDVIATLNEQAINIDLTNIMSFLNSHMQIQLDAIGEIYQKYDADSN